MLFSLVILVMKIARNNACSNIPFHARYLDDGAVAGPRSSSFRILTLLQEEGPALCIIINLPRVKCSADMVLTYFHWALRNPTSPIWRFLGFPLETRIFLPPLSQKEKNTLRLISDCCNLRRLEFPIRRYSTPCCCDNHCYYTTPCCCDNHCYYTTPCCCDNHCYYMASQRRSRIKATVVAVTVSTLVAVVVTATEVTIVKVVVCIVVAVTVTATGGSSGSQCVIEMKLTLYTQLWDVIGVHT